MGEEFAGKSLAFSWSCLYEQHDAFSLRMESRPALPLFFIFFFFHRMAQGRVWSSEEVSSQVRWVLDVEGTTNLAFPPLYQVISISSQVGT